jgi:peptidoglycan hydrolase-like protein with peptidoglycan-binding domain
MALSISRSAPRPASRPAAAATPVTLRLGATGPAVSALQQSLSRRGESVPATGTFGPRTAEAVRRYQLATGILPANGIAGPATLASLAAPPRASGDSFQAAATARTTTAATPARSNADLKLGVFDSHPNWQPFFTGTSYGDPKATSAPFAQRVSQRLIISQGQPELGPAGSIFTETKQVVKATPEKILAQLRDPHFWNNGSVDRWTAKPDGSFTYALFPAGHMAGVKVNETMHPPERQADGSYVVRIDLSRQGDGRQLLPGQAEGLAYILIKPRPDGSSEVFGRFAGVRESNPLFSAEQFAKNHLLGERGELKAGESFINKILPNETGFGAMLQRAEQSSP